MSERIVKVGTRQSRLALAQTGQLISCLQRLFPAIKFKIIPITTAGDRISDKTAWIGRQGVFVKEIEEQLLNGQIDCAVHSLKDMPCDITAGLSLGAISRRENPQDVLISRNHQKFFELAANASVGTSSVRRRAQILAARADLNVVELRGNVDTRLKKMLAGEVDAIVLAAAGVIRLGQENLFTELMPFDIMLPAPCQGALAIEIRENDVAMRSLVASLDDLGTRACVTAERAFLKALGGGCSLPIGALAEVEGHALALRGQVVSPDGKKTSQHAISGAMEDAQLIGQRLAQYLLDKDGAWIRAVVQKSVPKSFES